MKNLNYFYLFTFTLLFLSFASCLDDYNDTMGKYNTSENPSKGVESEDAKYEKMRTILEGLPEPEPELKHLDGKTKEEIREILQTIWDRRQKELKEAMESMTSDAKEMKKLIDVILSEESNEDDILLAIDDLEYYAADLNNAKDLDGMGGFSLMVHILNDTNSTTAMKRGVLSLFGTSVKNDRDVQDISMKYHPTEAILRELQKSMDSKDELTLKKAVYCIGSLLRHNPAAQIEFNNFNGFEHFNTLLNEETVGADIKKKIYNLVSDLLDEETNEYNEKIKEYFSNFCGVYAKEFASKSDLEYKEKILYVVLSTLNYSYDKCYSDVILNKKFIQDLLTYREYWIKEFKKDRDNEFIKSMFELTNKIYKLLKL